MNIPNYYRTRIKTITTKIIYGLFQRKDERILLNFEKMFYYIETVSLHEKNAFS